MRNVFLLFVMTVVFLGIGCGTNKGETGNTSTSTTSTESKERTTDSITKESVTGEWKMVSLENTTGQVERVTMFVEQTDVSDPSRIHGSLLALVEAFGAAKYEDVVTFSGTARPGAVDKVYDVSWQGSRNDSGTATVVYDAGANVLRFEVSVAKSDGLYTIPERMILYKEERTQLSETDLAAIGAIVETHFEIDVTYIVESMIGGVVKVSATPADSVTEPAYLYLKKQNGEWQVLLGPVLYVSDKERDELQLPAALIY